MPNVLCVDDHSLILEGLKSLLDQIANFQWVGEFQNLEYLEAYINKPHFVDVVLIDLFFSRENKLSKIGELIDKHGEIKWIIISAYESSSLVQQAFAMGVCAYLRKDVTLQELSQCLQLVSDGKTKINYTLVADETLKVYDNKSEGLSIREKEIISLIVNGNTEQKIAELLFISKHTVHTHRKNILRKLGIHSNLDIIRYYIENNL